MERCIAHFKYTTYRKYLVFAGILLHVCVHSQDLVLSHHGNPESYSVDGKTYYVLKTAKGYESIGITSWYGADFHKKSTSSGEKYNMYAFTAAHKTLPLPTLVRVTNLENNKIVVVKVNDRGPFHDDRILDLSYAAAKALGILKNGTAKVKIEALAFANAAQNFLQAGAFSNQAHAMDLEQKLAPLIQVPIQVNRYKKHFVVLIGPIIDKQQAQNIKKSLAQLGIKNPISKLL